MTKMFVDGVANDSDLLMQFGEHPSTGVIAFGTDVPGFREWAQYRDVWKDI
jgi:hypothetical protein